jgi:hypothetical protein
VITASSELENTPTSLTSILSILWQHTTANMYELRIPQISRLIIQAGLILLCSVKAEHRL